MRNIRLFLTAILFCAVAGYASDIGIGIGLHYNVLLENPVGDSGEISRIPAIPMIIEYAYNEKISFSCSQNIAIYENKDNNDERYCYVGALNVHYNPGSLVRLTFGAGIQEFRYENKQATATEHEWSVGGQVGLEVKIHPQVYLGGRYFVAEDTKTLFVGMSCFQMRKMSAIKRSGNHFIYSIFAGSGMLYRDRVAEVDALDYSASLAFQVAYPLYDPFRVYAQIGGDCYFIPEETEGNTDVKISTSMLTLDLNAQVLGYERWYFIIGGCYAMEFNKYQVENKMLGTSGEESDVMHLVGLNYGGGAEFGRFLLQATVTQFKDRKTGRAMIGYRF